MFKVDIRLFLTCIITGLRIREIRMGSRRMYTKIITIDNIY